MSSPSELPLILVSAKSKADASYIISELVDHEPPDTAGTEEGRVWRIVNKYYEADVALRPVVDGEPPAPAPAPAPAGHVIYLAADECTAETAERRLGAGSGAEVLVLAAETARLPAELAAWAARRRYEPVALRARGSPAEPAGVRAARAALHAHAWPGLRRRASPPPPTAWDEEAAAAARWADALAALGGGAAAAVRALPPPQRRDAAEALVAAFARALGHDPADL